MTVMRVSLDAYLVNGYCGWQSNMGQATPREHKALGHNNNS